MKFLLLAVAGFTFILTLSTQTMQIVTLNVFAAASLADAFEEISDVYGTHQPEVMIQLNFAGSSTLATQIRAGAPADIFASANQAQMQVLIESGDVLADQVFVFAENELVIVVPADNPAQITQLLDLSREGILLALAAPDVPVRVYTDRVFDSLATEYGPDIVEAIKANIVSEEENVRRVFTRVVLGEADAGIVYRTDYTAKDEGSVQVIPILPAYNQRVQYVIAPIGTDIKPEVQGFLDFILSTEGQAILGKWGFCATSDAVSISVTPIDVEITSDAETTETPDATSC